MARASKKCWLNTPTTNNNRINDIFIYILQFFILTRYPEGNPWIKLVSLLSSSSIIFIIIIIIICMERIFRSILFWAASVILFFLFIRTEKNFRRILLWAASVILFYYPHRKNFPKDIVLSYVWFLFFFLFFIFHFFYVTTTPLESLNQSEPNFHTWLFTRIARLRSKMGIEGQT